jgi:hypothetical protein
VIDQRLDALDRALLGLLPRGERLAMVAGVESRVREACSGDPAAVQRLASPADETPLAEAAASRGQRSSGRRRSTLALTSGVVGIAALVLLFAMPLTYLVVATTAEAIGELTSYLLLSGNVIVVALGGAAAVIMGITALVRLGRRQGQVGHGWAITGLCTGPLPALVGGLAMIVFVVPMMAELASVGDSPSFVVPTQPVSNENCATCPAPVYAPAAGMPAPLVAAAPASGYVSPPPSSLPPPGYYPIPVSPGNAAAPEITPTAPAAYPSTSHPTAPLLSPPGTGPSTGTVPSTGTAPSAGSGSGGEPPMNTIPPGA